MQITARDIRLGPEHLEKMLSPRIGEMLGGAEKLRIYKRLIKELENGNSVVQGIGVKNFCLGYLYHLSAQFTEDGDEKRYFLEVALKYYEDFIQIRSKGEPQFFACYSAGILIQALKQPWLKAEQQFLAAYELSPQRGEPVARIIQYYLAKRQWPIAYLFSSAAKEQFYGKVPEQEKWEVDRSFYGWRVLHFHAAACFSMNRMQEASENFALVYRMTRDRSELFLPEEIKLIMGQRGLFPEFETYVKNSA